MQFTQAGLPLSFEVTYDSPLLYVGMEVYDDSGVSPALVSLITMDNYAGNSYRAKFTPVAGKTYVLNKAVYTDNSFLMRDVNYPEASESFRAEDIASIVLDAMIASHIDVGSVGEAIQKAADGYIAQGNPIIGIVQVEDEL